MASGPGSIAEDEPPILPVKQRRSQSLRLSMESDSMMLSPVGHQHPNYKYNDVFPEPTDCHAAQCPIHQRYDPLQHQERFFSDGTPPPVPKKRLARTFSLPCTDPPPLSPLTSVQIQPRNFDNPLYMLTPMPNIHFHGETNWFKAVRGSPVSSLSFSQLSFDTPDEHLPYLFSSFDDQRVVFQGIQHRHLLFLRSMAQSVEARTLLQWEAAERDVSSYQPQDFLLCEGSEPKQIGDMVYYSLHSPKLPGKVLGLKLHKHADEASPPRFKLQPAHVNVQDVIACFQPNNILSNDSNTSQAPALSHPPEPDCSVAKPAEGVSAEGATAQMNTYLLSAEFFLSKGHSVSVERDLPYATVEDFVEGSRSLQSTDCWDYDRQVCVLLLQILTGSQHLHNISAPACKLKPQEIFLVWPNREKKGHWLEHNASEMTSRLNRQVEWETMEKKGKFQMLWRTHGAPRVVLTPLTSAVSAPQPLTSVKSQIGALIQYCLDPHENLTSPGSVPAQCKSSHRRGLLYLASLLRGDSGGPQVADMVAMLQVLLWGPNISLLNQSCPVSATVHNWLTIKRALLVMKLAEKGLIQDQSALDWEDCMCLQYLSFTDPETVESVSSQLQHSLNVN